MVAISGMMLGLNSLEFNICLKDDDLSSRSEKIDWSLYFRDPNANNGHTLRRLSTSLAVDPVLSIEQRLQQALEQKTYVEQQNKDLLGKLRNLLEKQAKWERDREALERQCMQHEQTTEQLEATNQILQTEMKRIQNDHQNELDAIEQEKQTHQTLYSDAKSTMADLMSKLSARDEQISCMRERLDTIQSDLDDANTRKQRETEILKATQERLVEAIKKKEEYRTELEKQKELTHLSRADADSARSELAQKETEFKDIPTFRKRIEELGQQVLHFRSQFETANQARLDAENQASEAKKELETFKEINAQERQRQCEIMGENEVAERELKDYIRENEELRRLLQDKETTLKELASGKWP